MNEYELSLAVTKAIEVYETAIGSYASRTRQMIEKEGSINALSKLMLSPDLQQGFKVLRDQNKLDQTFETIVVNFSTMFESDAVEMAEWRLKNAKKLL